MGERVAVDEGSSGGTSVNVGVSVGGSVKVGIGVGVSVKVSVGDGSAKFRSVVVLQAASPLARLRATHQVLREIRAAT